MRVWLSRCNCLLICVAISCVIYLIAFRKNEDTLINCLKAITYVKYLPQKRQKKAVHFEARAREKKKASMSAFSAMTMSIRNFYLFCRWSADNSHEKTSIHFIIEGLKFNSSNNDKSETRHLWLLTFTASFDDEGIKEKKLWFVISCCSVVWELWLGFKKNTRVSRWMKVKRFTVDSL